MKVLHVCPSYYPATAWGGPIFSTKAICDGIAGRADIRLRVLTTDAASPIGPGRVTPVPQPYPVDYCRRVAGRTIAPGLAVRLPAAIGWADVVHLTGTYDFPVLPTLALARLIGRPVVWSPRGALQATATWAAAPRRAAKQNFARIAQLTRPAATVLHVTSPAEAADSTAQLAGIDTACIPNSVDVPASLPPRINGGARLLYLGRLHPKKGLERLIDAMALLPAQVTLDIFGTGDPAYVAALRGHAASLGGRVSFHAHVAGPDKAAAFAKADLFVLPSFSENFGIVVAEALAHGLAVLTTTATPWQGLARHRCGRWIDPETTPIAPAIAEMLRADLAAMGARGRVWMARDFSPAAMAGAFVDLYSSLCGARLQRILA